MPETCVPGTHYEWQPNAQFTNGYRGYSEHIRKEWGTTTYVGVAAKWKFTVVFSFLMVTTIADREMSHLDSQISDDCKSKKSKKQGLGVTFSETQSKTLLNSLEKSPVSQKEEISMTAGGNRG